MFDIGWTELLVIGVVALIVVGPKDLPGMFRTLGRFTGKAKGMARDFQRAMNDAADSAGVKDVADDLKKATSKKGLGLDALDDVATKFENWDPVNPSSAKSGDADKDPGLSEERAAAAEKIRAATAKSATDRKAAEAEAEAAKKPAAKKPAAKKPAAKKPAAKKPAAKKPAAKPRKAAPKKTTPKTGSKT
jgi:sec-independent protein translocase protein TatB